MFNLMLQPTFINSLVIFTLELLVKNHLGIWFEKKIWYKLAALPT